MTGGDLMIDPKKHDGDCTIYSSMMNERPTDGICICGAGLKQSRVGLSNVSQLYSPERLEILNNRK